MKNKFLTHRQMGISEAFMKILPEMRLKNSNIKTLFIHLGKKEDIQRFMTRGDPELDYNGQDLIEIVEDFVWTEIFLKILNSNSSLSWCCLSKKLFVS